MRDKLGLNLKSEIKNWQMAQSMGPKTRLKKQSRRRGRLQCFQSFCTQENTTDGGFQFRFSS